MPSLYPPAIVHTHFNDAVVPATPAPIKAVRALRSAYNAVMRNTVAQPVVELRDLVLQVPATGAATGRSFDNYPADTVRSNSRQKRLHFAPVVETVELHWDLRGAAQVTTLAFEVYRRNTPLPLYRITMNFTVGTCPQAGHLAWNGRLDQNVVCAAAIGVVRTAQYQQADFPGDALCVEHGPYKFKLVVLDPGNAMVRITPARWVYADVLLGKPTLHWLPRATLVASPQLPTNGPVPVERDHQVYDALVDVGDINNLSGAVPDPGQTKRVYLQAHRFYRDVDELVGNSAWHEFHALWGEGPNIPLLLTPAVLRSDDQAVSGAAAVPALGAVKFVWEWVDKALPARGDLYDLSYQPDPVTAQGFAAGQADAQTFVDQASNFDIGATSPPGRNCHVERGGKRGPGAPPVFPASAGGGVFPFAVSHPAAGNWAALSSVATAGAHAGHTGVIFQPSIQPGDSYQLRVGPVCAGLVDPTAAHAAFHQAMDDMPVAVRRDSGNFEVWKTVEHTIYNADPQGLQAAHCATVATRFEKLNIRVRNTLMPLAGYSAMLTQMYGGLSPSAGLLELPLRLALAAAADHADPAIAVWFKPWMQFKADLIVHCGGLGAANAWAEAYVPPTPGLWRGEKDAACFSPEWPCAAPVFVDHIDPAEATFSVRLEASHVGDPLKISSELGKPVADARVSGRNVMYGLHSGVGSYRTADALATLTIHCQPADRAALTAALALGFSDAHEEYSKSLYERTLGYAWGFRVMELVINDLVGLQDGLMTFQFNKPNNIGPSPSAKAAFASNSRASIYMYMLKTQLMEGTVCHEMAHAMFINHPHAQQPDNDPRDLHDAALGGSQHCTMWTPANQRNFCGLCMLRLRAWSIYELDANRAPEAVNPVPNPVVPDMHVRTLVKTGAQNTR